MRAHLLQLNVVWENKAANHARVRALVEETRIDAGDLIVLPELFDVGFTLHTGVAVDHHGSTLAFLQTLADDTRCIVHGARALASETEGKALNCATIAAPGRDEPLCEYAKVHPFSYGREGESYTGGDAIKHYDWGPLRVCPSVCYDLRFPELYRLGVKAGASAFVLGANWPAPRRAHWRALNIARAIENQAFVIAVNRCGSDPHLPYAGGSIAVDPRGEVLGELGDQEAVLSIEIDPRRVRDWREHFPALRDITLI